MPIITFEGPELPDKKKKEMIEKLTKTAAEVAGEPEEAFIVLLKKLDLENVGFGGHQVGGQDKKN